MINDQGIKKRRQNRTFTKQYKSDYKSDKNDHKDKNN